MINKNKKTIIIAAILVVILIVAGVLFALNSNKENKNLTASNEVETIESEPTSDVDEIIEDIQDESIIVEPEEIEVTEPEVVETETEVVEENTEVVEEPEVIEPEVTEPVEEVVEESTPTPDASNVNYALPYIVNGIDIRSGDLDGDGISDNHNNTWYDGQTWTSSSGYVLRIADGYKILPGNGNVSAVFTDGTENIEPGSDFMIAFGEYTGRLTLTQISAADLPDVATPASLQTVANKNDPSWVSYITAFNPLWQAQNVSSASELLIVNNGNGFALTSTVGTAGYMWEMNYDSGNGCWVLEISSNYTELIWNSIRNSIRLVCPDGEAVYNAIYQSYYNDNEVSDNPGSWFGYGNSSLMGYVEGNIVYYCIK